MHRGRRMHCGTRVAYHQGNRVARRSAAAPAPLSRGVVLPMPRRALIQRNRARHVAPRASALATRSDLSHRLHTSRRASGGVRLRRLVAGTAQSLALAAGWTGCWAMTMQLRPLPATAGAVLITGVFWWLYVARPVRAGDRRLCAALRLRSPGAHIWWVLPLLPCWLALQLHLLPPAGSGHLSSGVGGGMHLVPLALVTVLLIPLVEGFFFQGFIQQRFRRAIGILPALLLTSALGTLPPRPAQETGPPMLGGLVHGAAVHATRSVWSGVLLNAGANAGALAALWLPTLPRRSAPAAPLATTSR